MPHDRSRHLFRPTSSVVAVFLAAIVLAGCATPAEPAARVVSAPIPDAASEAVAEANRIDPFACGMAVTPTNPQPGGTIEVSRTPEMAAIASELPGCALLETGVDQTFHLTPSMLPELGVAQTPSTEVAADGSFSATIEVPTDFRIGQAIVFAVPTSRADCSTGIMDCVIRRAYLSVGYSPEVLSPTTIVENDPVNPELETAVDFDRADSSWAMRDEANDGITIAIFGSSCETRPTQFVDTGDESVLTLISEEIMPAGMACFDSQNLWMTAIEIPEGYENFTSVTVDNGASVLV